ncbi:hypothetical protein KC315_g2058 [Hortaea werneckii]|nr:hypothetical protein KC315_g2058 [Hortaea werneckii]
MNPVNQTPYHMPKDATWLITGCSTGIGRALAELIASKPSHHLIATARNPSTLSYLPDNDPRILKLALDVTRPSTISACFATAAAHFGGAGSQDFHLDLVVNNAGYSLSGDTEAATEDQMHEQFETNFFGTVCVAMKAVEIMRQRPRRDGGLVFNLSSLAGVCAFPGHAFYHASKFAVEGWTESVAREMSPEWKINFCLVEPAGVKTNFEGHSKAHTAPHPAYADPAMPSRKLEVFVNKGMSMGMGLEPAMVAKAMYDVASRGEKVPLRLPLSSTAVNMMRGALQEKLKALDEVESFAAVDMPAESLRTELFEPFITTSSAPRIFTAGYDCTNFGRHGSTSNTCALPTMLAFDRKGRFLSLRLLSDCDYDPCPLLTACSLLKIFANHMFFCAANGLLFDFAWLKLVLCASFAVQRQSVNNGLP